MDREEYIRKLTQELLSKFDVTQQSARDVAEKAWAANKDGFFEQTPPIVDEQEGPDKWMAISEPEWLVEELSRADEDWSLDHKWKWFIGMAEFAYQQKMSHLK